MQYINIVYEDDYTDCDIIQVPDHIASKIEDYGQLFCDWLRGDDIPSEYYYFINGMRVGICETQGFIKWLNMYFCDDCEKITLIYQHVPYDPQYKRVDF